MGMDYVKRMIATGNTLEDFSPAVLGDSHKDAPRILFLIDEMAAITAGGTERQLLQLAEIAIKAGLSPQICVLRGTKWLTPAVAGCPVKHFGVEALGSRQGLLVLRSLTRWIREQRFDMMQLFFPEANLIGPWIGRLARVPVILGSRRNMNHASPDRLRNLHRPMQWCSNLLVDQVIANSTAVLERVIQSERLPRRKICVVYNGIDANQVRPMHGMRAAMRARLHIGDDELLVGNISGLRKIKGVECFVQAAALARRVHPKLRFVLVGEGFMRETLERMVAENNLQNILVLAGAAEDVRPYLAAMDIAVLCSLAEGFSNSLLEYMLAGLPIVATDVGGNREALGGAGVLIEAGDAQQLATAIGSLTDVDARDHYGAAASTGVRRFDLKVAEARMGDLFWSHLETKSQGKWSRPGPSVQKISPVTREIGVVPVRSDPGEVRALASAGDVHRT